MQGGNVERNSVEDVEIGRIKYFGVIHFRR
jgi:hypothetical protein